MSQHPSLRLDSVGTKHRNVLKRFERVKKLRETGRWNEKSSIYNLPKVKSMKVKLKKAKEAKEPAAGGTGETATPPPAAAAAKAPVKAASDAKKA